MIAIGGVIGTGLFIGTANNLQNAGPAGLLLSYVLMATLLYSVMVALGEMISAFPIPGAQLALASRFFAPEVGFAIGWLYWYCYIGASLFHRRGRACSRQSSSPRNSRLRPCSSRTGRLRAPTPHAARAYAATPSG